MTLSKEEATKYMILMVNIHFSPFPKNLKQEEKKIEKFLSTIDHFMSFKHRARSSHPSVNRTIGLLYMMTFLNEDEQRITVNVIDRIKEFIDSLGYDLDIMVSNYVDIEGKHIH